ncbi:MAG: PaREP1 family protein [Candidatus Njordarchaeia archaeon]
MFQDDKILERAIEKYKKRADQLLDEARVELDSGDVLQAGEKIWGLFSAIINLVSLRVNRQEATSISAKRYVLTSIIPRLLREEVIESINENLSKIECRSLGKLFERLNGIHRNFYGGGKNYDFSFLKRNIEVSISIAEKLITMFNFDK